MPSNTDLDGRQISIACAVAAFSALAGFVVLLNNHSWQAEIIGLILQAPLVRAAFSPKLKENKTCAIGILTYCFFIIVFSCFHYGGLWAITALLFAPWLAMCAFHFGVRGVGIGLALAVIAMTYFFGLTDIPDHTTGPLHGLFALVLGNMLATGVAIGVVQFNNSQVQHRLNTTLRKMEDQTAESARFIANLGREIRPQLTGIVGAATDLRGEATDHDAQKNVQLINQNSQYILEVVNQVVDLSQTDGNDLSVSATPFDLRELLQSVVAVQAPRALSKGISFGGMIEHGLETARLGDEDRLKQLLHSLLMNAIKFTAAGRVEVLISQDKQRDEHVVIQITDTGLGFSNTPPGAISSERKSGWGDMSLNISKRIIEAMGGTLQIERTPETGTMAVATIQLPHAKATNATDEDAFCGAIDTPGWVLGGARVLIVDDQHLNRLLIHGLLASFNASLTDAESGSRAIECVSSSDFDLIFIDLTLPGLNGDETARRITDLLKAQGRAVPPLIALSAHTPSREDAVFSSYVIKPIRPQSLFGAIAKSLSPSTDEDAPKQNTVSAT